MDSALREALTGALSDLIGDVCLLECLLDRLEADYCTPEVLRTLRVRLSDYIEQHSLDLAWAARALTGGPATPPA